MKYRNQFGKAFRHARRARGLTQEDFANESGRTYIGELERGVKHATLQKIDELATPLHLHPLTLVAMAYMAEGKLTALDELLARVREEAQQILETQLSKK